MTKRTLHYRLPLLMCLLLVLLPTLELWLAIESHTKLRWCLRYGVGPMFVLGLAVVACLPHLTGMSGFFRSLPRFDLACFSVVVILSLSALYLFVLPNNHSSRRTFLTLIILLGGALLLFLFRKTGKAVRESVLLAVFTGIFLYALVFFALSVFGFFPELYDWTNGGKLKASVPGYANIRHLGYPLSAAIVIGTYLSIFRFALSPVALRVFFFVALSVVWGLLLWTGSRGGVLSTVLGVLITLFFVRDDWKKVVALFSTTAIVGAGLSFLIPEELGWGMMLIFKKSMKATNVEGILSSRTVLWREGLRGTFDHPLLGHGIGQFRLVGKELHMKVAQAHNFAVESLYALGVVGGMALLVWVASLWNRVRKIVSFDLFSGSSDPAGLAAFACINTFLVFSLVSGVFFYYRPLLLSAILFSIALSAPRNLANRDA